MQFDVLSASRHVGLLLTHGVCPPSVHAIGWSADIVKVHVLMDETRSLPPSLPLTVTYLL